MHRDEVESMADFREQEKSNSLENINTTLIVNMENLQPKRVFKVRNP